VLLRVRLAVLRGQTMQHRLPRTPPGEVVARAMDADRFARYADRWVDFVNAVAIVGITMLISWNPLTGLVLLAVLVVSALATTAVNGFDWFGRVAGAVITEAPGVRAWKDATSRLAGGVDLTSLPSGVDLVRGTAPTPGLPPRTPLRELSVVDLTAVHPDGTI